MDLTQLSFNDHTLFHMLRHFENINDNARNCLLERGYQHDLINENLKIAGSKFDKDFATDIKSLIEGCSGAQILDSLEHKKYLELVIKISSHENLKGIGTLGVYNRIELRQLNAPEPFLKMNRGQLLWHVALAEMPRTDTITFVIKKQAGADFLITAFPGLPTLPLPNQRMNKEDFLAARNYWNEKVFLEKTKK